MDHEQKLLQLREFDDQVSYNENPQAFATKSFLETLTDLIQEGIARQNDGSDSYKEELRIIKSCIRAFASILPNIFKTVGQNEAESRLWELTRGLMTLVETNLVNHENTGVKIASIKCLQVVVLLLSKASQIRPDHRLLNPSELEKEAHEVFKQLLGFMKSDNESVLTATISCLVVIVRKRNNLLKSVANLFQSWRKSRSKDESSVMLRNVEKALKLAFIALIRTESLAPYRNDLITSFGIIGGNVNIFQSRHARAEEARKKRHAAQQEHQEREKRAKTTSSTEYVPIIPSVSSPNVLLNYDITQIPLQSIVSLCMTVLQTVPLDVMNERVSILPSQGVTLAVTRPGFTRSSTPPYPPPPEAPAIIKNPKYRREEDIKKEAHVQAKSEPTEPMIKQEPQVIDSDEEMDENYVTKYKDEYDMDNSSVKEEEEQDDKPKVEVLASVEERASQSLKMKPYALEEPAHLDESEKKLFIKMSIQRILENMTMYQSLTSHHADRKLLADAANSTLSDANSDQSTWFLLVAKLMTKGLDIRKIDDGEVEIIHTEDDKKQVMDVDTDTSINDIKELLLNYITEDLPQRHDLALDWLYEEYLNDKRLERLNKDTTSGTYFYWLHRILEKIIPTLDAKDRILTKLLLDAPDLDSKTIELVKANIPERFVSCVSTLRSLVTNRPTIRYPALQVLLDLCTHDNDKMRRTSIVAVKKWNANQNEINNKVEEFSVKALNELTTLKDDDKKQEQTEEQKDDEQQEEQKEEQKDEEMAEANDSGWNDKDVIRHAELYFVLCTRRPSLVKQLFSVYIKSEALVKKSIEDNMTNMIKSIGMKSQDLVQLIREFPEGAESLVIRIISILCESKQPTREIVSAVESISEMAAERSIDLTSLSPILSRQSLSLPETIN